MGAASPPTTVEAVPLPSTLPIRTAVTMAVVAVVITATVRHTAVVAAAAEIVEERITIMVTERRTAVARWEGFTTLFNFFLSLYSFQRGRNLLVACMCTCSSIHSFIRHVQRTTYNEDPTPIHIKKRDTDE